MSSETTSGAGSRSRNLVAAAGFLNIRLYIIVAVFTTLDIFLPWLFHQYHLAGPTFLPMHLFVLLAGLLFGWRAGLLVGLLTPLLSFGISGKPVGDILPQITVELLTYGFVAGVLRQRFHRGVLSSLVGAMVAGRLALGAAVLLLYAGEVNPAAYVGRAVEQGLPGILLQLMLIPPLVKLITVWWEKKR
jgi:thiamine transporter ThiT